MTPYYNVLLFQTSLNIRYIIKIERERYHMFFFANVDSVLANARGAFNHHVL